MDSRVFLLQPGVGLGNFSLGMLVNDAVDQLLNPSPSHRRSPSLDHSDKHQSEGGCGLVTVGIGHSNPRFFLDIVDIGTKLWFDGATQCLQIIEIYDSSRIKLACRGGIVFDRSIRPVTYSGCYDAFGTTTDCDADEASSLKPLAYPGLLCLFDVKDCTGDGSYQRCRAESLFVLPKGVMTTTREGAYEIACGSQCSDTSNQMEIHGILGKGIICVSSLNSVGEARRRFLLFGDSPQDVVEVFGTPEDAHKKESAHTVDEYVFNYYHLGIDVVFDGVQHIVKTFVMHTNAVDHPEFGRYAPCVLKIVPLDLIDVISKDITSHIQDRHTDRTAFEDLSNDDDDDSSSHSPQAWMSAASSPGMTNAPTVLANMSSELEKKKQRDVAKNNHGKKNGGSCSSSRSHSLSRKKPPSASSGKTRMQSRQSKEEGTDDDSSDGTVVDLTATSMESTDRIHSLVGVEQIVKLVHGVPSGGTEIMIPKPSVIYWNKSTPPSSTSSASDSVVGNASFLYRFKGLDAEYTSAEKNNTTGGSLAALYLSPVQ